MWEGIISVFTHMKKKTFGKKSTIYHVCSNIFSNRYKIPISDLNVQWKFFKWKEYLVVIDNVILVWDIEKYNIT